ncbi:hypothetical protein Hanom_Chr12g01157861 [Helianthus anomalus]
MVRVRHFEFLCRSHDIEPIVESFHDWKQEFFIREEVIPIAMIFRAPDVIDKEELPIPKGESRYLKLTATLN